MPDEATQKITTAEFEVMNVLWCDAPLAATDIADRLADRKKWSARTVKTLLARLAEKGVIAFEEDGRRYLYRPLVSHADHAKAATRSFVDRFFGGRAAPLVAHLAEDGDLNDRDIADLEALLEELKNGRK
ncbi:MAG: BlaI/MecI/CopY family transcriptional regulator [Pseudomonadota bacterium]